MKEFVSSPWVFWAANAVLWAGAVTAYLAGNALLRVFAAREPELWRQAGMPSHLFGGSFFSVKARGASAVEWLTRSPEWIGHDPQAQGLLSLTRVGTGFMAVGLLVSVFVLICI